MLGRYGLWVKGKALQRWVKVPVTVTFLPPPLFGQTATVPPRRRCRRRRRRSSRRWVRPSRCCRTPRRRFAMTTATTSTTTEAVAEEEVSRSLELLMRCFHVPESSGGAGSQQEKRCLRENTSPIWLRVRWSITSLSKVEQLGRPFTTYIPQEMVLHWAGMRAALEGMEFSCTT